MTERASVPFVWVDAFTARPFGGNPAAVCLLEGEAPAASMQALATEIGLSETAFVWPSGDGYALRWFTPAAEVDLCGHATVATAHALRSSGRAGGEPLRFLTNSGVVTATFAAGRHVLDMPSDPPTAIEPPDGLPDRWPVRAVAAGRFDLVVELPDADAVRAVQPDEADGVARDHRGVIVTGPDDDAAAGYVLRFFAPAVGVPEDPVTGSAQCTLAPHWAARLGAHDLVATQLSRRGGVLHVTLAGDRVMVGGEAVTVLEGELAGPSAELLARPA